MLLLFERPSNVDGAWVRPLGTTRREALWLAGCALGLSGRDTKFWDASEPERWSLSDVYELLNHSPWAKPVRGFWPPEYEDPDGPAVLRPHPPQIVVPPDAPVHPPAGVVTWESARVIRDAVRAPLPSIFRGRYVLGVDGFSLEWGTIKGLKSTAVLRSLGRTKWVLRPDVVQELTRGSIIYAIGFPSSGAPIEAHRGDVVFNAALGSWLIEARFDPRKMTYHGQLAV